MGNPAERLGDWFYHRLQEWSDSISNGRATIHMLRKTMLQHARNGEDLNRQVAQEANVGVSVVMAHYVEEMDEQMRQRSNRTYQRILASLSPEVRRRYGYVPSPTAELEARLRLPIQQGIGRRSLNWLPSLSNCGAVRGQICEFL